MSLYETKRCASVEFRNLYRPESTPFWCVGYAVHPPPKPCWHHVLHSRADQQTLARKHLPSLASVLFFGPWSRSAAFLQFTTVASTTHTSPALTVLPPPPSNLRTTRMVKRLLTRVNGWNVNRNRPWVRVPPSRCKFREK